VYPDGPAMSVEEAERERDRRRLLALGIARLRGPEYPVEPAVVGEAGEPAVVEGVRGEWRVEPSLLDGHFEGRVRAGPFEGRVRAGPFEGRVALLSPFDRLVHDRTRTKELFEFDYQLEMYKPAAKRRWGYFALPVLYGDRLVGKVDAIADRKGGGVLRVNAVHQDVPFSTAMAGAVDREIADLAGWLGLELRREG
jgi:uncharacterized protein YcaQ